MKVGAHKDNERYRVKAHSRIWGTATQLGQGVVAAIQTGYWDKKS